MFAIKMHLISHRLAKTKLQNVVKNLLVLEIHIFPEELLLLGHAVSRACATPRPDSRSDMKPEDEDSWHCRDVGRINITISVSTEFYYEVTAASDQRLQKRNLIAQKYEIHGQHSAEVSRGH